MSTLSPLWSVPPALCVLLTVVGRPNEFPGGNYVGSYGNHGQSLPIPVPTQLQNYQRMEQNLHSTKQDGSPRSVSSATQTYTSCNGCKCKIVFKFINLTALTCELFIIRLSTPVRRCSSGSSLGFARAGPSPPYGQGAVTTNRRLSLGGTRPLQLSPQGSTEANLGSVNLIHRSR